MTPVRRRVARSRSPHKSKRQPRRTGGLPSLSRSCHLRAVHLDRRRTPRISCEAVPPSILPAGAQGGTLSCRSGAALSFVSCIRLFGNVVEHLTLCPPVCAG